MADFKLKKAGRGFLRTIKMQVTKDSSDKSSEYIDQAEMIRELRKRVIDAQIWECPLENLSAALQAFGVVHQGIIITMESGKKYLVHKLPSGDNDGLGCAVVAYASKMGKQWTWVESFGTKTVTRATLQDYLDKCGDKYDFKWDNCLHAVKRMWELD